MKLELLPGCFSYYSFKTLESLRQQNSDSGAFTCTIPGDYSLMVPEDTEVQGFEDAETDWRCMAVSGQLAFSETGIASVITSALADAGISVLVMSGYKTDYFFIKSDCLETGLQCLRIAGHQVAS